MEMYNRSLIATTIVYLMTSVAPVQAQVTLEGIAHPEKSQEYVRPVPTVSWLPDGNLAYIETSKEAAPPQSINPVTGKRTSLLPLERIGKALVAAGVKEEDIESAMAGLMNPQISSTGEMMFIAASNDIYQISLKSFKATRLTNDDAAEAGLSISDNDSAIAYVKNNDLHLYDLKLRQERRLTEGGSATQWNGGVSEVGNLQGATGYTWAPGSQKLVYFAVDTSKSLTTPVMNYFTNPATVNHERALIYVGMRGHEMKLFEVTTDGKRTELSMPYDSQKLFVFVEGSFSAGGEGGAFTFDKDNNLIVQYTGRGQRWIELVRYKNGVPERLLREDKGAWQNGRQLPTFLPDGGFLWASDTNGQRHVYRYDSNGKQLNAVTKGNLMVWNIHGHDPKTNRVLFSARPGEGPFNMQGYAVGLDGEGQTLLTSGKGTHNIAWNDDFSAYLDTYSSLQEPPVVALFDTKGKETRRLFEATPKEKQVQDIVDMRFQKVKARDGTELEGMLILPKNFDPTKKYPILHFIYGFSANEVYSGNATVNDSYTHSDGQLYGDFLSFIASQGYVVWTMDSRAATGKSATESWKFFKRSLELELQDQQDGLAWLATQPWADMSRVGIHGWSTGGTMVQYFLTHSKSYKIGIAGAPAEWTMAGYDEIHMGTLEENAEGYERQSIIKALPNMHGKMMIVHGTSDINCPIHNTMVVMKRLQQLEKPHEALIVPGMPHTPDNPEDAWTVFNGMWSFLKREL
jgi:dipeptidyl-peptidase 4